MTTKEPYSYVVLRYIHDIMTGLCCINQVMDVVPLFPDRLIPRLQ